MKFFVKYFLLTLFLIAGYGIQAQKHNIKGNVVDSLGNPQPWATAALLKAKDSSLVNYALTSRDGAFVILGVDTGSYVLQVNFTGMSLHSEKVVVTGQQKDLNVGTIMLFDEDALKEVSVMADHIPIRIKADTVEFNADAYGTDPNANVEELLKKMPGFEVDSEGNLTVNGEKVGKIMVNGKEFFGGDGKIALQNLPADAVDKVQVYDRKSEKAMFTGVDDGDRTKTVDLKLKKDKTKGAFGNINGGMGIDQNTDAVYNSKLSWNKFDNKMQLSFIGTLNNINQTGFSYEEFIDFVGGMNKFSQKVGNGWRFNGATGGLPISNGLGQGRALTSSGGVNFNYTFKKKTELSVSYLYYRIDNLLESENWRENYIQDGSFRTEDSEIQNVLNSSHRVNMRFDHAIDSMTEMTVKGELKFSMGNMVNNATGATFGFNGGALQNASERSFITDQESYSGNIELFLKRKLKKKGRSIFAEGSFGMDGTDNRIRLDGLNTFNVNGSLLSMLQIQNQLNLNNQMTISGKATYTEPLKNDQYLEFKVSTANFMGNVDYSLYDVVSGESVTFNPLLSNKYVPGFFTHRGGATYMRIRTAYNLSASLDAQMTNLNGELTLRDTSISKPYFNLLPRIEMNINMKQGKRLRIELSTEAAAPSIEQVQPVVDNSNPLEVYIGNPELDQEYRYRLNMNYNAFNPVKMSGWFGGVFSDFTTNSIVNATIVDENLIRYTTPVNVAYATNTFFYLNRMAEFKALKSRYSVGINGNYSRRIMFLNGTENVSNVMFAGIDVRVMNKKTKVIDVLVNAKVNYNYVWYDLNANFNSSFLSYTGFVDFSYKFGKNWLWRVDFDYTMLTGQAYDAPQRFALLSSSLSYYVLDRRGEVKFYAFDIFNQNQSITRTANLNYLQETRLNIIQRYYMLSFTWNLAGKKPKGSDGGGHFRMWRR